MAKQNCDAETVKKCVKEGKYCNVETNKCVLPKSAETKIKKDKTLSIDNDYGIFGKTKEVNKVKKSLTKLTKTNKEKLVSKVLSDKPPKAKVRCNKQSDCPEGKICNTDTSNCVQDTSANRKKLGLDTVTRKTSRKAVRGAKKTSRKDPVAKKTSRKAVRGARKTSRKATVAKKTSRKATVAKKTSRKAPVSRKTSRKAPVARKTSRKAPVAKDYSKMSVAELKDEFRKRNISGFSKLKKAELIEELQIVDEAEDSDAEGDEDSDAEEVEVVEDSDAEVVEDGDDEEVEVVEDSDDDEYPEYSEPSDEEDCTKKYNCNENKGCNATTKKCISARDAIKGKLYQFKSEDSLYYGTADSLTELAKELKIENLKIIKSNPSRPSRPAARPVPPTQPPKLPPLPSKPPKLPPLPSKPPVQEGEGEGEGEDPLEFEYEEEVVEEVVEEEPEELTHQVTEEQPLTREQQELVKKIEKCLGI